MTNERPLHSKQMVAPRRASPINDSDVGLSLEDDVDGSRHRTSREQLPSTPTPPSESQLPVGLQQSSQKQTQQSRPSSPPSPPSPPILMQDDIRLPQHHLENRVAELELKLRTVSRLLQVQESSGSGSIFRKGGLSTPPMHPRSISPQHQVHLSTSTSTSCPSSPVLERHQSSSQLHPPLDSPHPDPPNPLGDHHRRLSHIILGASSPFSSPTSTINRLPNNAPTVPSAMDVVMEQNSVGSSTTRHSNTGLEESLPNLLAGQNHPPLHVRPVVRKKEEKIEPEKKEEPQKQKWLDYLNSYQDTNQDVDLQMEEFVRVPKKVEVLLWFGFWICTDCFLYTITILPIRFVWSCCLGLFNLLPMKKKSQDNPYQFHRRHLYQLISISIIFFVYYYVLMPISIGKLYHWIRGQALLKLYLLLAIVEVFDRLMCSLGQDCLDSLYWNTTRRPRSFRMLVSFFVVLVYATIHTMLLFVHVATLNVAMNSSDQALLSLLIGGNFAEIKSTVFKKYNKQALFKISVSDICERFKLALFLTLVLALNMCQGMSIGMVYDFLGMCALVYIAEFFSDWIKHAFITKFNFIKSGVYPEYALLLAGDVTGIGHEGVNLDHSHAVVKRIGFPQIPLVCVMARYLTEGARYLNGTIFGYSVTTVSFAVWCVLVILKIISGSLLSKVAKEKLKNAPKIVLMTPAGKSKKKKD